ncbi:MAG: peptidoglycan-binding protein, partial [Peptococcaceae bacterium]|nr:peptidoglycan-binding protein [Peptococcaceae bacterium]
RKLPKEDRPSSSVWFTPPKPDTPVSIYARPRLKAIADERAWKFGLQPGQEWDKEGFLHQKESDKVDSVAALLSLAYYIGDDPLQIGHTGEPVAALQSFLGLPATGNFDEVLESSVKQVQKKLELPETGVFDGLIIDTFISLLTRADADLTRKAEKEAGNKSHRFDRQASVVMMILMATIAIGLLIASYRLPD